MFSIIIPLYNKEKYIAKAIESVLAQTCQDFELIIIDDGSTDNSFEIAKKSTNPSQARDASHIPHSTFNIPHFTIIKQSNYGASTTRNRGVEMAKYDYIAFLDADDWWESSYLEEMKALIEEFPDAALYASSYYKVKLRENIPAKIGVDADFQKDYFDYFEAYAKSPWMPIWTGAAILKKSVYIEMNGFKAHLKLGEDFDLWARVALKYKTALVNKPLAFYNQDVALTRRAVGNLHKPENHMLWNLDFLEEAENDHPYIKPMLDNLRVYGLFRYYLNKSTRKQAQKELEKVDWSKQDKKTRRRYKMPIWLMKLEMGVRKIGSRGKKFLKI